MTKENKLAHFFSDKDLSKFGVNRCAYNKFIKPATTRLFVNKFINTNQLVFTTKIGGYSIESILREYQNPRLDILVNIDHKHGRIVTTLFDFPKDIENQLLLLTTLYIIKAS